MAAPRGGPGVAPPAARVAEVGTPVLVAGVDGYRRGWVAVSLDPSGDVQVSTHSTFAEVLSLQARVIAIDIPIDPPGRGARPADAGAPAFVGGRASSVFPTPPRAALEASVLTDVTSVMDFGIILGALLASALAGRFSPGWRVPWRSALAAVVGGVMLGYGARLAYGCNIGAYFSGIA